MFCTQPILSLIGERAAVTLIRHRYGGIMTTHPTKDQVQRYLTERHQSKTPPPTPEQIRKELGWHMLPNNRK